MSSIKETVNELRHFIAEEIKKLLLEHSKQLFDENPDLTSFGWHQFLDEYSRDRYIKFEDSINRPDVSGSLGEFIYSYQTETFLIQRRIAAFLSNFDKDLLLAAFGDGVDVAVYRNGIIEITGDDEYDFDRLAAYEL